MESTIAYFKSSDFQSSRKRPVFLQVHLCRYLILSILLILFASCLFSTAINAKSLSDKEKMDILYIERNDIRGAYAYAQKIIAKAEDPSALIQVGLILGEGKLFQSDKEKALQYFVRAKDAFIKRAEGGDWEVYLNLAAIYRNDIYGMKDLNKSDEYQNLYIKEMNDRAKKYDPKAILAQANCYDSEEHIKRVYRCYIQADEKKKLNLIRQAAELGNSYAEYLYGDIFQYGKYGVEKNSLLASKWYLKSVENSVNNSTLRFAYEEIAKIYLAEKNYEEAIKYLSYAVRFGSFSAQEKLARIFSGSYGAKYIRLPSAYMLAAASERAFEYSAITEFKNNIFKILDSNARKRAIELDNLCKERDSLECDELIDSTSDTVIVESGKPLDSEFQKCIADRLRNYNTINVNVLIAVRRACASVYERDLSDKIENLSKSTYGDGKLYIKNETPFNITEVCIMIKENDSKNPKETICSRDFLGNILQLVQIANPNADPSYVADFLTVKPYQNRAIEFRAPSGINQKFWDTHSWSFRSIKGF